jgi:hypothetical protein
VTPATKIFGEFIIGDNQMLIGTPAATAFVGYTWIINGRFIVESGYCAISQTKNGFDVIVGVPYSIHYILSLVNLYMSSIKLYESSWISILSPIAMLCNADVNWIPNTVC